MSRVEILKMLKSFYKKHSEQYGIINIGLFGSVARGQGTEKSDIDIVVKLKTQDLFNLIGIKQDLEKAVNVHVDVISYRKKMNQFLKSRIDKEAVYV